MLRRHDLDDAIAIGVGDATFDLDLLPRRIGCREAEEPAVSSRISDRRGAQR
jgi:hypothetical protein